MTPYEVYFYSSGGIEDRWSPKDLGLNRANAIIGYGLGGFLSFALMIIGGALFLGHGISPEHLGTIALGAEKPLGRIGLLLALVGILFAVGGASIDTVFSGAYNLAQFCGWEWGRYRQPRGAPRFTLTWLVLLVLALAIVMTGVDPVVLTEYAVIFSVVALPLTYIPILLVANDSTYMGRYRNGRLANVLGLALSRRDHGRRADRHPPDDPHERGPELSSSEIDIGLHVLDHQLLDKDGRRCGNVDDLAIEGGAGEAPEVVAILVGPGYWPQRAGLIGRLAGWIGGGRRVRVAWSDVRKVDSAVELKREATELGLGRGDDRLRPYLDKIPGARPMRTLSSLLRRKVVTESGPFARPLPRPPRRADRDRSCASPASASDPAAGSSTSASTAMTPITRFPGAPSSASRGNKSSCATTRTTSQMGDSVWFVGSCAPQELLSRAICERLVAGR